MGVWEIRRGKIEGWDLEGACRLLPDGLQKGEKNAKFVMIRDLHDSRTRNYLPLNTRCSVVLFFYSLAECLSFNNVFFIECVQFRINLIVAPCIS